MGFAEMDAAAKLAHEELAEMRADATLECREGLDLMVDWLKRHFRTADYKRLCRPLVHNSKQ